MNSRTLYILFFALTLCRTNALGQNDSISSPVAENTNEKIESSSLDADKEQAPTQEKHFTLDVKDFQLQKRYRPSENDTLLGNHGLRRLYLGGGVGLMVLSDKRVGLSSMTYNAYLGYRFSPVHALRADFSFANLSKEDSDQKIKSIGLGLTYQTDLTNFIGGYRPSRLYSIGTILSGGARIQPDLVGAKMRPYISAGLHISGNPMENIHLFVEPYVGLMARMSAMYNRQTPSNFNIMYGVTGGLQFSSNKMHNHYPESNPDYLNWFIDIAHGMAFNLSSDGNFLRSFGSSREAYIGRWFNPFIGLRVGAHFTEVTRLFNENSVVQAPTTFRSTQVALGGGVEFMVGALNFSKHYRDNGGASPWDLNILAGVRFGWLNRANPLADPDMLRCFYWAPTVALQPMYRVSPGAYIFVEPRWTRPIYYTPYQNTSHSVTHHQDIASVAIGARVFRPSKERRDEINNNPNYEFIHHAWAGVNLGIQRAFAWKKFAYNDADRDIQPTVGVSVGYDITPLHSARLDASMQRLKTSLYENNTLSQLVTYKADLRLLYMLNFSNLWQGTRADTPFKVYGELGPVLSIIPSSKQRIEATTNVGVAAGLYASLRVAKCLDITAESLGELHSHRILPAQNNTAYGQIEMAFSVGTRYHFLPDSRIVQLFENLDIKKWNKGFFIESSYGADIPVGTPGEKGVTMSGMAYNFSMGMWLNELFGVRAGLTARENSWAGGAFYDANGNFTRSGRSSVFFVGRGELIFNPLSLLNSRKDATVAPKFDLNISIGGEIGVHSYFVNEASSGFHLAMTTSMQALYRVTQNMQLFAEPRYTTTGGHKSIGASLGMRMTRATGVDKNKSSDNLFEPKLFFGLNGGWAMPIHFDAKDLRALAPTVGLHVGYRFKPAHGIRLSANYEATKRIINSEVTTYPTLSTHLMYQMGLSNLWTKDDESRWNFLLGFGPAVDIRLEDAPVDKKVTFGMIGSMILDYSISSNIHIFAEPFLQYNFSNIYPYGDGSRRRLLKLGAEFGVSYHL